MNSAPDGAPQNWPRKRVAVVAAEVLLVVALVALNLYLWLRPGPDHSTGASAASDAVATSPASLPTSASSATGPAPTTWQSAAASPAASATAASPAPVPTATPTSAAPSSPTGQGDAAAALKAAGRLVAVVDSSDSMGPWLPSVQQGLTDLLRQAPDGVTFGLVTFSPAGTTIVINPQPVSAQRAEMIAAIDGLTTTAGTTRPLLDALTVSYQHVLAGPPGTDPAPILLVTTNGGRTTGADLQTFAVFAKAESAKRARSAVPRFVAITPGADVPLLTRTVAALGSGEVIAVTGADRLRSAILDLPVPTPIPATAGSPS